MTQTSFLRLLTTEAVMREHARTNDQAIALYASLLRHQRVRFTDREPVGLEAAWRAAASWS